MAGIVPKGKSGRKQWTLHDGPRGSLRRLRSQLANDGCADSQVVLAKQLFDEECELDVDRQENAKLGVYWLIKASEQGNDEATELLGKCLATGRGITEQNYLDVKACIGMTQYEKIARKAAREMFASLSNGEDFITSEQLQKRMLEISGGGLSSTVASSSSSSASSAADDAVRRLESDSESEPEDWTGRAGGERNEKLTEEHMVAAAADYSHGQLPTVSSALCLTEPDASRLERVPLLRRSVSHPVLGVRVLYSRLVRAFARFRPSECVNRADAQIALLVAYLAFGFESASAFASLAVYYASLAAMVVTTFRALQAGRNLDDLRVWSRLFLTYSGGSLDPNEAESRFMRNQLRTYGQFFVALLVNLLVYPAVSAADRWIPQSELTVVSFCLTFVTLLANARCDATLLLSFALNVLAKYPYETDPVVAQGWRFLDLKAPTFASYVIGSGIEFCLNFRLLFYIAIPIVLVVIAARDNWRGTYKHLIPHCVTLAWLQFIVINSQGATMFGLLRGTLALVGSVLFLPLAGVTAVLLPAVALAKTLIAADPYGQLAVFLAVSAAGAFFLFKDPPYAAAVQVSLAVLAAVALSFSIDSNLSSSSSSSSPANLESVSWESYRTSCHQTAWDDEGGNVARAQIKCRRLEGATVRWSGYVQEVKLRSVSNAVEYVVGRLPYSDRLRCYFGEPSTADDDLPGLSGHLPKCHLNEYDRYEYDLSVRMQSGIWGKTAEVMLKAAHAFTNFTLGLRPNDKIWFKGRLVNDADELLGGARPRVRLDEIVCLACHRMNLTNFKADPDRPVSVRLIGAIVAGGKFVLNLIFNPIVVFK